ncbi:hypothetical protein ACPB3F_20105, partial [Escherichia coli]
MITIPITFRMLIAKYLCLLKPFWLRKNNKTSVLLIIIILAMILGVVKIQVWLNDWNNDFFNALSQKETGFAPIFPDTCYHLTHYWLAAVDIPV